MVGVSERQWGWLERNRSTAFLVAGAMFVINAVVLATIITGGSEDLVLVGQAFIAAGWTAGFVGLFGLYRDTGDRRPWLARIGAVLVAIGVVVFVVMAVASLLYYANVPSGEIEDVVPLFLPGVILGSVLGFITMGAATLRAGRHRPAVGALLVILGLVPVANIARGAAGFESVEATLVVVCVLILLNLAIGYLLRSADRRQGSLDAATAGDLAR